MKICIHFDFRNYTMSHKTRATLLSTVTLPFLEQFLRFLYQWEQERGWLGAGERCKLPNGVWGEAPAAK